MCPNSVPFNLVCVAFLPRKSGRHQFPRHSRTANSVCSELLILAKIRTHPSFYITVVLVTSKSEEKGPSEKKTLQCSQYFSHYKPMCSFQTLNGGLLHSLSPGLLWWNFELMRDFMVALITCKNEEDQIKK